MRFKGKVKKRYLVLAVVVLIAALWAWKTLTAPQPQYQTLIVRKGDLEQTVLATGKLDALKKVDVGAQVSGQLKTLSVEIGDKVKKDQLLGVIDPEQAENQIKGAARPAPAGDGGDAAGQSDPKPPTGAGQDAGRFTPGFGYRGDRADR